MSRCISEEKALLRRALLRQRSAVEPQQRQALDKKLNERLCQLWQFREAALVLGYYPIGSEADIRPALLEALRRGKRLALPRCVPGSREMEFFLVEGLEDLPVGEHRIPEPDPDTCRRLPPDAAGLCLVPGLAFDRQGFRLGYGKGYYDRFLLRFSGNSLGLCHDFFLLPELPRGCHDVGVGAVLTTARLHQTGNATGQAQTLTKRGS
ncbi:MAG: 5-formyltetrahydrofolate cyclo-ligase [Oscillospiraceae bacterium]|jgi:5-formyltetrahydrofolate cyclo-ligase|nr:5-formyltetrahydrofolate cyclo-ligase [Oscillospiraceae bacterium]